MTTETQKTDEGQALDQEQPAAAVTVEDDYVSTERDPMLEEAEAAEAEVAAEGPAAAEGQPEGQPPAAAAPTGKGQGDKPIMVPKARLDEVLGDRDLLKDQVGYQGGVIATQERVIADLKNQLSSTKPAAAEATQPAAATGQPAAAAAAAAPDQGVQGLDNAIKALQEKKLALADEYDNGEISTRIWKQREIEIENEIRALDEKRLESVKTESLKATKDAISAVRTQDTVEQTALTLQQKHPNIAVIDALSPGLRAGVWSDITNKAAQNLAQRGIDARLHTKDPQIKAALMAEKARLTDKLEDFLPGYKPAAPAAQPPAKVPAQVQKQPSALAQARAAKLELADSQPPSIADMGRGVDNGELTEEQVANMTEDQMADLLTTAPHLVKRIAGSSMG